jgi:tetrahydromethanopterin S-methyltransferase subunit G
MAEEGNGHGSPSRLDRIERAIEALIDGHDRLLASQNQLLTAQVVMTDTMTALTKRVEDLAKKIDAHEDRIQVLIDSQLRVDETLADIKKLLERRSGDQP